MKIVSRLTGCAETLDVLNEVSEKYGLTREVKFTDSELLEAAMNDKKRSGGTIDLVVCEKLGECGVKKMTIENLRKMCE
jgi:3-dehydroquinate synthetase